MIKVVLVTKDDVKHIEIEPELEKYYELLECDLIDITQRKVGGKYYDIICDDEGLLKPDNHLSGANFGRSEPMLVGNLIFCKHDGEGNETGLSLDDIENILRHTGAVATGTDPDDVSICVDMDW